MQQLANICVNHMIEMDLVLDGDREVYRYGFEVLLSIIGSTLVSLIFGILTGCLIEVIAFILAFIPIRCCCGGYHASSPRKCFLISLAVIAVSINVGLRLSREVLPFLIIMSLVLVFWLAPVIHPNHPHSQKKQTTIKKRARIVGVLQGLAIAMLQVYNPQLAAIMALALLIACLGMPLDIGLGKGRRRSGFAGKDHA